MPISVITPAGKSLQVKTARVPLDLVNQVAATDVTSEIFGIGRDDIVEYFTILGATASDDTGTATLSVGTASGTTADFVAATDVKVARTTASILGLGLTGAPQGSDEIITASYQGQNADAAAGGPWYVNMYYYSVNRGEV